MSDLSNKTIIKVRNYPTAGVRTSEGVPMYGDELANLLEDFMNIKKLIPPIGIPPTNWQSG